MCFCLQDKYHSDLNFNEYGCRSVAEFCAYLELEGVLAMRDDELLPPCNEDCHAAAAAAASTPDRREAPKKPLKDLYERTKANIRHLVEMSHDRPVQLYRLEETYKVRADECCSLRPRQFFIFASKHWVRPDHGFI